MSIQMKKKIKPQTGVVIFLSREPWAEFTPLERPEGAKIKPYMKEVSERVI